MKDRYLKQEMCAFIGVQGQQFIREKHVLIVGAGALGSTSAELLVRSGVGVLTIIDRDYVEWSNLHRQQLYSEMDCREALPKAIAAKRRLQEINSEVEINAVVLDATAENLQQYIKGVDVIIDATDNFDIRFILNDLSQKFNIPFIFGACVGSFGSTFTIIPRKTPCLHCLLKQIPLTGATCDSVGVISPIVQMIASLQVTECLKLLVEDNDSMRSTFLSMDLWKDQYYTFNVEKAKRQDCLSCGDNAIFPYLQYDAQTKVAVLCGRNTVQIRANQSRNLDNLEASLKKQGTIKRNPFLLSYEMDAYRFVFFEDGRVFIHGISDVVEAKKLYYRLLG